MKKKNQLKKRISKRGKRSVKKINLNNFRLAARLI
jgi:hypothetical protein